MVELDECDDRGGAGPLSFLVGCHGIFVFRLAPVRIRRQVRPTRSALTSYIRPLFSRVARQQQSFVDDETLLGFLMTKGLVVPNKRSEGNERSDSLASLEFVLSLALRLLRYQPGISKQIQGFRPQ